MKVRDSVQEAVIKTIPEKKKWIKAKWLSEEALQIAEQWRGTKDKWQMKIYTHLNAEFQRVARRDKKAFLSDQCKEWRKTIEWGRLESSSRKLDTKGTFHAKEGTIKHRNGMDFTEAEDVKKRWKEYTEELYKEGLHDWDNHNGMIAHLEPDILEMWSQVGLRKHDYEQS